MDVDHVDGQASFYFSSLAIFENITDADGMDCNPLHKPQVMQFVMKRAVLITF